MSAAFPDSPAPVPYPHEPKVGCGGCGIAAVIGCLGMFVVAVVACAGGGWYVRQNADKWVAGYARDALAAVIETSEIPESEKIEVIAQIDRVANAYKTRQIDMKDLERVLASLEQSPIFLLITVWGLEQGYLEPSGLSDEEKAAGRQAISRAMRGVYEQKITMDEWDGALPGSIDQSMHIETNFPDSVGQVPPQPRTAPQPNTPLTDAEVRQMVGNLKKLADDAAIPDEPFSIDIGNEVKKAVDRGLQGKGSTGK